MTILKAKCQFCSETPEWRFSIQGDDREWFACDRHDQRVAWLVESVGVPVGPVSKESLPPNVDALRSRLERMEALAQRYVIALVDAAADLRKTHEAHAKEIDALLKETWSQGPILPPPEGRDG